MRIISWIVFIVLLAILLMSVFDRFGSREGQVRPGIESELLFLLPFAFLAAASFVGRNHAVSALVAIVGIGVVMVDMISGIPFSFSATATWIRWLVESVVLLVVVSLLTWRSGRTR